MSAIAPNHTTIPMMPVVREPFESLELSAPESPTVPTTRNRSPQLIVYAIMPLASLLTLLQTVGQTLYFCTDRDANPRCWSRGKIIIGITGSILLFANVVFFAAVCCCLDRKKITALFKSSATFSAEREGSDVMIYDESIAKSYGRGVEHDIRDFAAGQKLAQLLNEAEITPLRVDPPYDRNTQV